MKTHKHEELADRPKGHAMNRGQDPEGPRQAYEHQDLGARLPTKIIAFMVVFVPLCLLLLWGLMATVWQAPEAPPSPFDQPRVQTPTPQLQRQPIQDYAAFYQRQARHLHGYGWLDRSSGRVHVPIEVAKQRLLERGLPDTTPSPSPIRGAPEASQLPPTAREGQ